MDDLQRRALFIQWALLGSFIILWYSFVDRTKEFKDLAGRSLDNRTRWNSWHHMLRVALQHEAAVDSYTKNHFDTLQAEYLSPVDWESQANF